MDQILRQVGELLLGAVPTVVLLLLLYAFYSLLVGKPLRRVLEERRERTEGAVQKARADIAAAEAKTQEYEQKLRDARLAVYKSMEARRQRAQQVRMDVVDRARARAEQRIGAARLALENDMAIAKAALQEEAGKLASEIVRAILRPADIAPVAGGQS